MYSVQIVQSVNICRGKCEVNLTSILRLEALKEGGT